MIQKRIARVGLAKQTAKGSAAAAATYGFGLRDGTVVGMDIQQEVEEVTTDKRINPGDNRLGMIPGMEYTTRMYPKLTGLLLYGALGNIVTTPGIPNSHVITPGDDLPYLTAFARQGSEYWKVADCKIDELTLSWDGPGPLEVATSLIGIDLSFLGGAAYTITNDENDAGGKFRAAGGTFKLDVDSATPVTAPIRAGEIGISNALEAIILAEAIKPNDVFPGVQEPSISLTTVPNDLLRWREIVTGSAGGTAISDVPIYGSYEVKFVLDANTDLLISATRVPFMADFPDVDPSGGAQELVLTGAARQPSSGAAITATLRNDVVSY